MNRRKASASRPVGRPRVQVEPEHVHQLRIQERSWREIAKALTIGTASAMRLFRSSDAMGPNINGSQY